MHNCRQTKNLLLDLALGEVKPIQAKQVLAELDECRACQDEYATLRNTLRVSVQSLRSALPAEDFWAGHHARLRVRLMEKISPVQQIDLSFSARLWNALRKTATASVRVPVPAALAIMLLFGSLLFAARSRGQVNLASAPVVPVEPLTVQVPVIQEKVLTKVVYIEKKGRRSRGTANQVDHDNLNAASSIASGWQTSGKSPMSLADFKPTDQLQLKIIKRGYRDER